jgi:hypothetical protein
MAASYATNVDFVAGARGDTLLNPRGDLARLFRSKQGQLRVRSAVSGLVYANQTDRNRVDAEVGVDGTRILSPNATLRADASGSLGHTDSSRLLYDQGVLLPLSRTRSAQASAALDQKLGVRSSFGIDVRGYLTDFADPLLVDSRSLRISVGLNRQMSEHNRLGLQYSLEQTRSDASYRTNYASLQWSHALSRQSALLVEGGASRTGDAAISVLPASWNFYGGSTYSRAVGRNRILMFVRREVLPTFGVGGLRLSDRFGLTAMIRMGRTWGLDLSATHTDQSASAEVESEHPSSDEGTLTLRKDVGLRTSIAATGSYRHRGPDATRPSVNSVQAGVSIFFSGPPSTGR